MGGIGSIGRHQDMCHKFVPKPYFYEGEAKYEGSPGGRGNLTHGGAGGGIIWLSATGTITLNDSEITVAGQNGFPGTKGHLGSGGGAGGSVQIITKNIAGNNSVIDLSGGHGSTGGGGGGSGGRFVNYFLQNFNATNSLNQSSRWNSTIKLDGGHGGELFSRIKNQTKNSAAKLLEQSVQTGGNGQSGTTHQTKCFGGFTGPFCKPCEIGTFKYDFGYGVC